jgi:hypothetical protein
MALKKPELHFSLPSSCVELRGGILGAGNNRFRDCHALFVLRNPRAPLGLEGFSPLTQSVALGYILTRLWRSFAGAWLKCMAGFR